MARSFMTPKVTSGLLLLCLFAVAPIQAQSIREHTRPTKSATKVSDAQATAVTLTLNQVSVRPIQTWVRTAGRIDKSRKVLTAFVHPPEAAFLKVGQRVRAFPPESKSSMFQAWVTKIVPQADGVMAEVTLSGTGREISSNYVLEIVTERGEFLSIPNEAIIEEGTKRVVYVQRQAGQYVPVEIQTGIQGELFTAVERGLMEGDQVVSFGSFFVDAEYKLKSIDQSAPGNDQQHR